MKKLFLLPMMICLLLAGCRPDDGVDMPEPQKPVSELIQGKWLYAPDSSYHYFAAVADRTYDGIFFRPPTRSEEESDEMIGQHAVNGSYTLTESGGKTYAELVSYSYEYNGAQSRYRITTISDSKMTWEKESGEGPVSMEFTKIQPTVDPQQPVSELIQGRWYALPLSPLGFPNTYRFYDNDHLDIYNEIDAEGERLHYAIVQQDGKTYIEYYDIAPETAQDPPVIHQLEILDISDRRMTLKGFYYDSTDVRIIELIRA